MTLSTMLRCALLLLASFHASSCWDNSNIWFPDTNNPVFYNLTFYPQPTEEPSSAPEQPRPQSNNNNNNNNNNDNNNNNNRGGQPSTSNRQPERVPLFRPQEPSVQDTTPQVTRTTRPPTRLPVPVFRPQETATKKTTQNNGNSRPSNTNRQTTKPVRNPGFNQQAPSSLQTGDSRPSWNNAKEQNRQPNRNQQIPTIVITPPRNTQRDNTNILQSSFQRPTNNKEDSQPSGNRLRRTKNNGIGDANTPFQQPTVNYGDYRNSRASNVGNFEEVSFRQNPRQENTNQQNSRDMRDTISREQRVETSNNGLENGGSFFTPTVMSSGGNRRNWETSGDGGSGPQQEIEDNIIADEESTPKPTGPSKCVWAIISCCKPSSPEIRYMCFETLGCHGAFWDNNPCSPELTMAAVQATANFYNVAARDDN